MKTPARGFTLIEMLVASAIMMIAIIAAATVMVAGANLTRNEEQAVEASDNAMMAGEIVAAALRGAGVGSGNGMTIALNGNPVAISPIFGSDGQLDPQTIGFIPDGGTNSDLSDEFWAVVPAPGAFNESCPASVGGAAGGGEATSVTSDTRSGVLPVNCASSFNTGDLLLVSGLKSSALITVTVPALGPPATISYSEQGIANFAASPSGYHAGDLVFRARVYHFFLGTEAGSTHPKLFRVAAKLGVDARGWPFSDDTNPATAQTLVFDDVEDMQVAYGLDPNQTGDPTQYTYVNQLPGCSGAKPFCAHSDLRSVRVTLISRGSKIFLNADGAQAYSSFAPLKAENKVPSVGVDGLRRSVYSRRIELPNLAAGNL